MSLYILDDPPIELPVHAVQLIGMLQSWQTPECMSCDMGHMGHAFRLKVAKQWA